MSANTGGPAFPQATPRMNGLQIEGGMTMRDYFAAKALHAVLVNSSAPAEKHSEMLSIVATVAYRAADAMLAAREVTE